MRLIPVMNIRAIINSMKIAGIPENLVSGIINQVALPDCFNYGIQILDIVYSERLILLYEIYFVV